MYTAAAGCGDKAMALRLVELGTDVNCKDSVGGTAMHHAAMANKQDMMFALARLGCDWRARADGIDGATATFVLCGQHGKTTRQQVRGGMAGPCCLDRPRACSRFVACVPDKERAPSQPGPDRQGAQGDG